ncbi:MAG: hypothetical protein H0W25_15740 [Acidimicrobiia bacterium]|nr:hypothetical protein [Acidimicrobiia bacterium]
MTVRLRPRGPGPAAAPPAGASVPVAPGGDDAIELFAPVEPGSTDDPFVKAFAEGRTLRHARPGSEPPSRAPRTGLVLAVLLLLAGILAAVLDGGSDDDAVATAGSTTTSSTSTTRGSTTTRPVVSTTSIAPTPTTVGFAVPTTAAGATPTSRTVAATPTTRGGAATTATTAPAGNQDLNITITLDPAVPIAGEPATVVIRFADDDAPPSSNCRVIEVDGEPLYTDPCGEPACGGSGGAAGGGVGGSEEVSFDYTFTTAGEHRIAATGQSLAPYCGDRFGSTATEEVVVDVAPAATTSTTTPSPTTSSIVPPVSP